MVASGFGVSGLGFRVSGFGRFRVLGFFCVFACDSRVRGGACAGVTAARIILQDPVGEGGCIIMIFFFAFIGSL